MDEPGSDPTLAMDGWKQFMDDIESAKDKIHLYQLVSKHVRKNPELRKNLYAMVDGLYSGLIKDRKLAKDILDQFYMDILEAKATFFDSVGHGGQLGLALAKDGEAMKPPVDDILNNIFGEDEKS
jgi:hypothetical protein